MTVIKPKGHLIKLNNGLRTPRDARRCKTFRNSRATASERTASWQAHWTVTGQKSFTHFYKTLNISLD